MAKAKVKTVYVNKPFAGYYTGMNWFAAQVLLKNPAKEFPWGQDTVAVSRTHANGHMTSKQTRKDLKGHEKGERRGMKSRVERGHPLDLALYRAEHVKQALRDQWFTRTTRGVKAARRDADLCIKKSFR